MTDSYQETAASQTTDLTGAGEAGIAQAGTAEFKTIKAGCGIRFDPDSLDEDAGFDFSAAQALKPDPAESGHSPGESSDT